MKKEKFIISGMTCSACSARVQKAVDGLPGCQNAVVNLLTGSMQIEYDEGMLNAREIVAAVEKAGYGAALADAGAGHGRGNGGSGGAAAEPGMGNDTGMYA